MNIIGKEEPVFDLIKSMSKSEKRNFKLYANRLQGNQDAKFVTLFDYLDSAEGYDEERILKRCPITKRQLPNLKAHLYRQILVSMRMLQVQHSDIMGLREQLEFAQILFDKALYKQSEKILDRLRVQAAEIEAYSVELQAAYLQDRLDMLEARKELSPVEDPLIEGIGKISERIRNRNELTKISDQINALYIKLGYARSQKDLDLIVTYFEPKLREYEGRVEQMQFYEKFYYYQARAWYYNIQHKFAYSYRYSRKWVELFDINPKMKISVYDNYIRGGAQILDGLYMMKKYRHFMRTLDYFDIEFQRIGRLNTNAYIIANKTIYTGKVNGCFIEGEFKKGLELVAPIEQFLETYDKHLDLPFKMMINYKMACLYFGDGQYERCMEYLNVVITSTKDSEIRRDLQCFARILNLIAAYEAGLDYNIEYKIRAVYTFLIKMNDLNAVQKEILSFLRRLGMVYQSDMKDALKDLYDRLEPFESHPYERRSFYYLDLMSWLESKITGRSLEEILKRKFREIVGED